jgi:hypothetical protein
LAVRLGRSVVQKFIAWLGRALVPDPMVIALLGVVVVFVKFGVTFTTS